MWSKILETLQELLTSKKFLATLTGILGAAIARLSGEITSTEMWTTIATALLVYIGAQGIADHGKEAVKTEHKRADVIQAKIGDDRQEAERIRREAFERAQRGA